PRPGRAAAGAEGDGPMEAVDRILIQRAAEHDGRSRLPGVAATLVLQRLGAPAVLVLPALRKPPKPFEFVPVQIVPAQALGVERPRAHQEATPATAQETEHRQ